MLDEVATWLGRLLALLPQIIGLWEAAKGSNPNQELEASLRLVRAMKDRQAHEEIEGSPPTPRFLGNPFPRPEEP